MVGEESKFFQAVSMVLLNQHTDNHIRVVLTPTQPMATDHSLPHRDPATYDICPKPTGPFSHCLKVHGDIHFWFLEGNQPDPRCPSFATHDQSRLFPR